MGLVTGTRTARYRTVPPKIDRRRSISTVDGRLKKKSTVDSRLREKSTVDSRLREKSTVDGRLREKSTVDIRLRKKKGRRRGKEEKKEEDKKEYLAHVLSSPAGRPRAVVARGSLAPAAAFFSRARRRSVSPHGEKNRDDDTGTWPAHYRAVPCVSPRRNEATPRLPVRERGNEAMPRLPARMRRHLVFAHEVASDKEKTAAKQSPPYEVLLIRGPSQGSPVADISDSRAVASSLEGDTVRGSLSFSCFFFPRAASCNQANTTRYSPVSDGTGLKPQYRLLVGGLSIGLLSEPVCTTYTGRYDSKLHILL
ncbi:hypothetical protein GW17_00004104 [Ensete ventricosum]|nr:hypothetical protein GW17_00004104 [Ensete ventricosum]